MATCIKICGITNARDAEAAIACGAKYLGLIFVPASPRCVFVDAARAICKEVRDHIQVIGVFRDRCVEDINVIAKDLALNMVQLHGSETVEMIQRLNVPVIKTIELDNTDRTPAQILEEILPKVEEYAAVARHLLFDRPKLLADRSQSWLSDAIEVVRGLNLTSPFFFAGGLTAENVGSVIEQVHPFGVDVTSSIEAEPGKKNLDKLKLFCLKAQRAGVQEGRSE